MILGKVTEALREAGYDQSYIDGYVERATAGDYRHLLTVSSEYADVEYEE